MSYTLERSYTVSRIVELGTGITVKAGGQAGVPGVGQVEVGAAVASHYNVSYGAEETVTRSITMAAEKGTNILYTVRQYQVWENGNLVIAGTQTPISYRFLKDVGMETLPPTNVGCPAPQAIAAQQSATPPEAAPTTAPATPPLAEGGAGAPLTPPVSSAEVQQQLFIVPVNHYQGAYWIVPETGIYQFRIDSGAYNTYPNDEDCARAYPDQPGCWHTRLQAYIGCDTYWVPSANSPDMYLPSQPDFSVGDGTFRESMEVAEAFATSMEPNYVSLGKDVCVRFQAVDVRNPIGDSGYPDNRGGPLAVRIWGPR